MSKNEYLEQVMQQQEEMDQVLSMPAAAPQKVKRSRGLGFTGGRARAANSSTTETAVAAIDYRITGIWRWQNVIVPPNIYAVHTRRGYDKPMHIGLGISFRYDPYRDTFILIPAAVQTLLISANCICQERQGILVQAYVQWVVDDVRQAYRRLDFSPVDDPMRIVNLQLKEQAEAAIKDKVATMSIDAVLSDKQPIIEELTTRLRTVAEGTQEGEGLGLKIVTVQIKEAVVSSISLWENLQKPFRAERQKIARMAELESSKEIATRELENRRSMEAGEIDTEEQTAKQRHDVEKISFDREQTEKTRRQSIQLQVERDAIKANAQTDVIRRQEALALTVKELEFQREQIEHEIQTVQCQQTLELAAAQAEEEKLKAQLARAAMQYAEKVAQEKQQVELDSLQQEIKNNLSDNHLAAKMVKQLPDLMKEMPKPETLHTISMGSEGHDHLGNTIAQLMVLMKKLQ